VTAAVVHHAVREPVRSPAAVFVRTVPSKAAAALSFFGWLYLSISLFLYAWVIGTQALMGWSPLLVTSDSMSPAVRRGDVVMVGERPPDALGHQTVIVFDDPHRPGGTLLHRISAVNADGTYQTRGDGNADADAAPVELDHVRGVGRMVVPVVGSPFVWLQEGRIGQVVAWAVGSVAAVAFAFGTPGRRRRTSTGDGR
jgi:signal peptidase